MIKRVSLILRDYILIFVIVYIFVNYCFSLFIFKDNLFVLNKFSYKNGDEVVLITDEVNIVEIVSNDDELLVYNDGDLLKSSKENVHGKIMFKIWPLF